MEPSALTKKTKEVIRAVRKKYKPTHNEMFVKEYYILLIINDICIYKTIKDGEENILGKIEEVLQKEEEKKNKKNGIYLGETDQTEFLKKQIRGKSWEMTQKIILKMTPAGNSAKLPELPADRETAAQTAFTCIWEAIHGGRYTWCGNDKKITLQDFIGEIKKDDKKCRAVFNQGKPPEEIIIYRGVPIPGTSIRPGDYASLNKNYARSYARGKFSTVIKTKVKAKDLILERKEWDESAFIYAPSEMKKRPDKTPPSLKSWWQEINKS